MFHRRVFLKSEAKFVGKNNESFPLPFRNPSGFAGILAFGLLCARALSHLRNSSQFPRWLTSSWNSFTALFNFERSTGQDSGILGITEMGFLASTKSKRAIVERWKSLKYGARRRLYWSIVCAKCFFRLFDRELHCSARIDQCARRYWLGSRLDWTGSFFCFYFLSFSWSGSRGQRGASGQRGWNVAGVDIDGWLERSNHENQRHEIPFDHRIYRAWRGGHFSPEVINHRSILPCVKKDFLQMCFFRMHHVAFLLILEF